MTNKSKKTFSEQTKRNSSEGMGIRTDVETDNLLDTTDQYAGDSVNEHKAKESANEHFAEKQIDQVDNNL